jgi:hypothetical protein
MLGILVGSQGADAKLSLYMGAVANKANASRLTVSKHP